MPDTTLRLRYTSGATIYTQIENEAVEVWDGTEYTAFTVASWASYATATPESPVGSGRYVCQFPASSPASNYNWTMFQQSGGSPAAADPVVGTGSGYWDGETFGNIPAAVIQIAGAPRTVTQDWQGTEGLRVEDPNTGRPILGATVKAFLAAAFNVSGPAAPVVASTTTDANGHWTLSLAPAYYTLQFAYHNTSRTVAITVS